MDKREILAKNVAILSNIEEKEKNMRAKECRLPSIDAVITLGGSPSLDEQILLLFQ